MSAAENPIQADAEEALYDWLSTYGSMGAIKVALHRRSPQKHKGVQVDGLLQTYDEPISDDLIQEEHGGGKYQIIVQQKKPNKNGNPQWKYAGARTFAIAGVPRLDNLTRVEDEDDDDDEVATHGDGPVGQAMNMMARMAERAEDRAERAEHRGGSDLDTLRTVMAPLQAQVDALSAQLAAKDKQVIELISKPPDNTVQDRVLGLMESKETAHGNAIQTIRSAHDSEMRQLRDFNREEIRRRESRFEAELSRAMRHMRARSRPFGKPPPRRWTPSDSGSRCASTGSRRRSSAWSGRSPRRTPSWRALRAQKQQGPLEQIQNLVTLKQGMEALVPTGSDEPTKTGFERVAETIMNSPLAEGIAARVAGVAGGPPQEEMVQVRGPDGRIVSVPASYIAQLQAQRAAQAAQMEGDEQDQGPAEPKLNAADVARAVQLSRQPTGMARMPRPLRGLRAT